MDTMGWIDRCKAALAVTPEERGLKAFLKRRFFLIALFGVLLLVYIPSLFCPFYFDDYRFIIENPDIKDFSKVPQLLREFFYVRAWVQISLAVDWWLYQEHIYGMHLTNLLIHLFNTWIVYKLAHRLFGIFQGETFYPSRSSLSIPLGIVTAFVFALHPLQTESVTYIISRSSMMVTCAYLLSFWALLEIVVRRRIPERLVLWKHLLYLLGISLVICLGIGLGIGAKENIMTLPIVFLVFLFIYYKKIQQRGYWWDAAVILAPFVLLFLFYAYMRIKMVGSLFGMTDFTVRTPFVNLLSQIHLIAFYYLPRIVMPVNLNLDPHLPTITRIGDPAFLAAFAILLTLGAIALFSVKKRPICSFAILWFFLTIAVTSSIIPLLDLAAEHRLYLPMSGSVILFEWVLLVLMKGSRLPQKGTAVLAVFLITFPTLTLVRNLEYMDSVLMWRNSAILSPAKFRPLRNVAGALIQEDNVEDAIRLFSADFKGVEADGRNYDSVEDLDFTISLLMPHGLYVTMGTQMAEQLVQANPKSLPHLQLLQKVYLLSQQFEKLQAVIDHTLSIDKYHFRSLINQSYLLQREGRYAEAIQPMELAFRLKPFNLEVAEKLYELYVRDNRDTTQLQAQLEDLRKKFGRYSSKFQINLPD